MKYIFLILFLTSCYCNTIKYIERYSLKWDVDPRVMMSLMKIESMGDRKAVSNADCHGLLQVSIGVYRDYFTWKYKKDSNKKWYIYSKAPETFIRNHLKIKAPNICIGTWHFKNLLDRYDGNYIRALNQYLNGNNHRVSWDYLYKIIDDIIKFK